MTKRMTNKLRRTLPAVSVAVTVTLTCAALTGCGDSADTDTSPSTEPPVASTTTVPAVSSRPAAEVAHAYWEAIAASDLDAAVALIDPNTYANAPRSIQPPGRPDTLAVLLDWYEAVGWEWQIGDCTDVSEGVASCDVVARTAWSDALGIEPLANTIRVRVGDDGITSLDFSSAADDCCPGFDEFNRWVTEMYPEDAEMMWDRLAEPDAETLLRLFELNTTRFVDAQLALDPVAVVNPLVDLRSRLTNGANDELFHVDADEPSYWRITTLPHYDGATFGLPERPLERLDDETAVETNPDLEDGGNRTIRQQVEIALLGGRLVPAAGIPVQAEGTSDGEPIELSMYADAMSLLASDDLEAGDRFEIVSAAPQLDPNQLRAATTANPPDSIYIEVPDEITDTVSELAAEVTADATTPYDAALALQNWFRSEFEYSLEVQPGHGGGALRAFIDERVGYSEQFAVAFAVFARTLGIPSQVAVGFTPGVLDGDGWYRVTGANAHAWPEIWFDDIGWVQFEPTPGREAPGIHTGT